MCKNLSFNFLFFLLCLTLPLPLPFIIFLISFSFLLSLLSSLTAPGAQLWPLVTLHNFHKGLTVMQGGEVTLCSPKLTLGHKTLMFPSLHIPSLWGKLSRGWTRWPWSHLPAWTTPVEETLMAFSLDLENSSNLLNVRLQLLHMSNQSPSWYLDL